MVGAHPTAGWLGSCHGSADEFRAALLACAASSRLPSPEQAKTRTMPTDGRLRFDDHQGVQNARRNPIEAGKNEAIEVAEGESLRGFSSEHVELVAQRQDLGLERSS